MSNSIIVATLLRHRSGSNQATLTQVAVLGSQHPTLVVPFVMIIAKEMQTSVDGEPQQFVRNGAAITRCPTFAMRVIAVDLTNNRQGMTKHRSSYHDP
jgi:hypothetical protein